MQKHHPKYERTSYAEEERAAVTFLFVGNACNLRMKPLFIKALQKSTDMRGGNSSHTVYIQWFLTVPPHQGFLLSFKCTGSLLFSAQERGDDDPPELPWTRSRPKVWLLRCCKAQTQLGTGWQLESLPCAQEQPAQHPWFFTQHRVRMKARTNEIQHSVGIFLNTPQMCFMGAQRLTTFHED